MTAIISSRTPEGEGNCCPVCRATSWMEPSAYPNRDAPCPCCGHLLWYSKRLGRGRSTQLERKRQSRRAAGITAKPNKLAVLYALGTTLITSKSEKLAALWRTLGTRIRRSFSRAFTPPAPSTAGLYDPWLDA